MKLKKAESIVAVGCMWAGLWGYVIEPGPAWGAAAIGTAATQGSFRVDGSTVSGNATLFEGTTIETHLSSSSLNLASGPRLILGADSRGRIFGDRLELERGAGEMHGAAGFRVEARGLTVRSETGRGAARIRLTGATRVQVAAIEGGLRVLNPRGVLVAELDAGSALEFEPQLPGGPAGEQEKLTGCLRSSSGHYLLTDEVTNVTVEVAGSGLDKEHGNRVQVTGLMDPAGTPVSGATQYVRVSSIKRIGRGCPANRPAAAGAGGTASSKSPGGAVPNNGAGGAVPGNGAGGAAPNKGGGNPSAGGAGGAGAGAGGASAGGIAATTLAIIGGVAAAVVVGGLAATGTFSSASSQESR